jgi:hypothetical protein
LTLQLFSIFHLNLAYSSIDEAQRPEVVRRCYWPLLRLIERTGAPIGIEATGFTLETAAAIDPSWLAALRALVAEGRCEFVGSGSAQVIGPLVPAAVNAANLRIGHQTYERLLGSRPRLAFVNEQAYSAGLVAHYVDAGYDAIVMEWDNPARAHPEWDAAWRYVPQRALGQHGESIPLIWNKAIAFQQFQRYAHAESSLDDYVTYLAQHVGDTSRSLAMYGNDAEIFDFRPGRYHTEAALAEDGEWVRIERLYTALAGDRRFELIRPSAVLDLRHEPSAGQGLSLESAADPAPVKKQRKYNLTRWAVTGRDDLGINTACLRRYEALRASGSASNADWKELCELWSSDYRTHITEARWAAYQERLYERSAKAFALQDSASDVARRLQPSVVSREGTLLTLRNGAVTLVLNARRGLAIEALSFAATGPAPLCGTLKHGFYDDIHRGADFYSGMTVMESPGRPKLTDLNRVEPIVTEGANGDLCVTGSIETPLGAVVKTFRLDGAAVELAYRLEWPEIPIASLRFGDITLHPDAFDRATLFYRTHNGGAEPETFPLDGTEVAHGESVSFLVSASHAVGLTEGVIEFGDAVRTLRIEVERSLAALVGMVTYQPVRDGYFCRVSFSAAEVDETRKAAVKLAAPLECRFRLTAR